MSLCLLCKKWKWFHYQFVEGLPNWSTHNTHIYKYRHIYCVYSLSKWVKKNIICAVPNKVSSNQLKFVYFLFYKNNNIHLSNSDNPAPFRLLVELNWFKNIQVSHVPRASTLSTGRCIGWDVILSQVGHSFTKERNRFFLQSCTKVCGIDRADPDKQRDQL
jgi:hypothetical protein